ncbi:MAG: RNA polymerase sigma factor [Bacteroidaceae bacterium]|nr:RNA polymerase sigma factor [Bacteroidaceae bacterium]
MTREEFITHVEREQEVLRSFLFALCCGNKDEADDLAQDSLVKAYLSSAGYQDKGKFRSWLFKIAHNTFLNHRASQHYTENIDDERIKALPLGGDGEGSEPYEDLYLALCTLPPKERSAITLFYLTGYSIKEIAQITDTSEDAVKKQLSRGRDKLKEKLKPLSPLPRGGEPSLTPNP